MDVYTALGYVATALGGVSYVPQLWRWVRGAVVSGDSVSTVGLALHALTNLLWIVYSVRLQTWPYAATSALSLCVDAMWVHVKASAAWRRRLHRLHPPPRRATPESQPQSPQKTPSPTRLATLPTTKLHSIASVGLHRSNTWAGGSLRVAERLNFF